MKVTVIGAGVMGTWTALSLQQNGHDVTLIESIYPGHTRSSSGGESRLIRGIYGPDKIYMDWVQFSMERWKSIEHDSKEQLFYPAGCMWMFNEDTTYGDFAYEYLRSIDWNILEIPIDEAKLKYPQINLEDIRKIYYEPDSGYLMARKGCQELKDLFVQAGGNYRIQDIHINEDLILEGKHPLLADFTVFALGPWHKSAFPKLLNSYLQISRQEIYYFTSESSMQTYYDSDMPTWIDLSNGNYYGVPITDQRGFKIADDTRRTTLDIHQDDRIPTHTYIKEAKDYLSHRFPYFENPILSEARVCQYTNTPDGHFILDFVPGHKNMLVLGGGCGHAYKLGPSIGKFATDLVEGNVEPMEMFSLDRLSNLNEFKSQFKRRNSFF